MQDHRAYWIGTGKHSLRVNVLHSIAGVGTQILITKDTLAGLGSDIKYRELDPVEVKGKTEKLEVFEILY